MKKDKNIIKLERDNEIGSYGDSLEDYDIKYLGDRISQIKTNTVIETIQYLNKKIANKKLTEDEIFLNYAKDNNKEIYKKLLENVYDSEKDDFKTLQDFINYYSIYEILDDLIQDEKDIAMLCENNNCNFGTVGYSPWSYYISWQDVGHDFIRDLYEGWNWYTVMLIENNDIGDSLGGCYITNEKELDECIKDNFGIDKDDYLLVDNEETKYFDKPKIKEIRHINYSYKLK